MILFGADARIFITAVILLSVAGYLIIKAFLKEQKKK